MRIERIETLAELRALAERGALNGWYDMPEALYHGSGIGLSQTQLKEMAKSPMHFRLALVEPRTPTAEMILGSAFHALYLEGPGRFDAAYDFSPEGIDRRTKIGKQQYAEAVAAAAGKVMLPGSARHRLLCMHAALSTAPLAEAISRACPHRELSAFWTMEGILCRGRFDLLGDMLVDLKTTSDACPEEFKRSAFVFRWDWQFAYYGLGHEALTGRRLADHIWMAVETDPPHGVAFYRARDEDLANARAEVLAALRTYAACQRDDTWPGYPEEIRDLTLPTWSR